MPPALVTIHTDGASRGNPGPAACSYTIQGDGLSPIEHAERLPNTTNNIAEYTAVVRALERAVPLKPGRVQVFSDSELMVKQVTGEYAVKNAEIRALYQEVRALVTELGTVTFTHVRREQNRRADELCNQVLDGKWINRPVAPLPVPSADGVADDTPTVAPVAAPPAVMTYLKQVLLAYSTDLGEAPSVDEVWANLATMLDAAKLLKKPAKKRATGTT